MLCATNRADHLLLFDSELPAIQVLAMKHESIYFHRQISPKYIPPIKTIKVRTKVLIIIKHIQIEKCDS